LTNEKPIGYKPFSKELYNENDDAKHLVIKWLAANGITAEVNKGRYAIDLVSDDKSYEVEVKHNWKGAEFPYEEVHFPYRKIKFATDDSVFVMLNHERTHALLVDGTVLAESKVVFKSTKYTRNEKFIEVKLSDCKIVELLN